MEWAFHGGLGLAKPDLGQLGSYGDSAMAAHLISLRCVLHTIHNVFRVGLVDELSICYAYQVNRFLIWMLFLFTLLCLVVFCCCGKCRIQSNMP